MTWTAILAWLRDYVAWLRRDGWVVADSYESGMLSHPVWGYELTLIWEHRATGRRKETREK